MNNLRFVSYDIVIRPYREGDEEGVVELLDLVFGGWPRFDLRCKPLDYYKWKYLENPINQLNVSVASDSDKVIGCNHVVFQRAKIKDKLYLLPHGADAAIHPDYREKGIYSKVRNLMIENSKRLGALEHFSVSANPILIQRNIRSGRRLFPFRILIYVRILDVKKHFENIPVKNMQLKAFVYRVLNGYYKIKKKFKFSEPDYSGINIEKIVKFDERIDGFWGRLMVDYDFIIERSRAHLNWRYCDYRAGGFIVKQAVEDGEVLGYIVFRINKYDPGYAIGYIVDLLTLQERLDAAERLLGDAVNYFDQNGVNVVTGLFVDKHPIVKVLNRYGFLNSREKINLFCNAEELNDLQKSTPDMVHFSLGDFDHI